MIHLVLHFVVPLIIAGLFFRKNWRMAYLVMMATMIIDADHLLATPIYDPNRYSIGFHPLHSYIAIGIYVALCFIKKVRLMGIGLIIHMTLDALDIFGKTN